MRLFFQVVSVLFFVPAIIHLDQLPLNGLRRVSAVAYSVPSVVFATSTRAYGAAKKAVSSPFNPPVHRRHPRTTKRIPQNGTAGSGANGLIERIPIGPVNDFLSFYNWRVSAAQPPSAPAEVVIDVPSFFPGTLPAPELAVTPAPPHSGGPAAAVPAEPLAILFSSPPMPQDIQLVSGMLQGMDAASDSGLQPQTSLELTRSFLHLKTQSELQSMALQKLLDMVQAHKDESATLHAAALQKVLDLSRAHNKESATLHSAALRQVIDMMRTHTEHGSATEDPILWLRPTTLFGFPKNQAPPILNSPGKLAVRQAEELHDAPRDPHDVRLEANDVALVAQAEEDGNVRYAPAIGAAPIAAATLPATPTCKEQAVVDYVARSVASKIQGRYTFLDHDCLRFPSAPSPLASSSSADVSAFGTSSSLLGSTSFRLSSPKIAGMRTLLEPATPTRLHNGGGDPTTLVLKELEEMVRPHGSDEEPQSKLSLLERVKQFEEAAKGKGKGKEMEAEVGPFTVGFVSNVVWHWAHHGPPGRELTSPWRRIQPESEPVSGIVLAPHQMLSLEALLGDAESDA
ncbi:hypothetical protein DFH09DRAFT_1358582 [Mycena vulgaris]|nr:hypothetical protein DFH09DRAFT_1358582 [Mycena vulgaris]